MDTDAELVSGPRGTERKRMMQLLAQGVPLTLILDLVEPPDAAELYAVEGGRRFEWYQHSAAGGQRLNREPIWLP